MEINKNLLISTTITSWGQDWEINANLGKEGYYMPSLHCNNPTIQFEADNSNWIIEILLPNLKVLLTYEEASNLTADAIHNAIKFELEELHDIPKDHYQTIVDLIEQAIELGFFKEYYGKGKR